MPKNQNPTDLFSFAKSVEENETRVSKAKPTTSGVKAKPISTLDCVYLRIDDVAQRFDVSRATIWRWASEAGNAFPTPIHLSKGTTRWRLDELEAYDSHIKACRGGFDVE